jgi:hypothetical protein
MEARTKYLYRATPADKVILLSLVGYMWLGTIFDWESFSNSFNARLLTSSSMLYLTWHFFASRKLLFIEITPEGVKIPNAWLPGIVVHEISWARIRDIESSWNRGLATIRIRSDKLFPLYVYKKCVRIHNLNMISASDASGKLLQDLRKAWKENS